eukprot:PhM_4_TR5486/c0_g1_i1/m.15774
MQNLPAGTSESDVTYLIQQRFPELCEDMCSKLKEEGSGINERNLYTRLLAWMNERNRQVAAEAGSEVVRVSVSEAEDLFYREDTTFVDIRRMPTGFKGGVIPGSVLILRADFDAGGDAFLGLIKTLKGKHRICVVTDDPQDDDAAATAKRLATALHKAFMRNDVPHQVHVLLGGARAWFDAFKDDTQLTYGYDSAMW